MLVVAGIAYRLIGNYIEDEAETALLEFLDEFVPSTDKIEVLTMWVSAKQDTYERVEDLKAKEENAT